LWVKRRGTQVLTGAKQQCNSIRWQPRGVENRSIFRQLLCVKELPVIYGEQAAAFIECPQPVRVAAV
jgi:hypothetical protein